MHACTIVARNYLAQAQVLVDSFRTHHPDGTFDVLLIDEPGGPAAVVRGADVVVLEDIGIAPDDLERMTLAYDLIELATAVKPWLLRSLLDRGFDHAVYFDPDISIERRIDELPALAREHSIVLTPHLTEPMPRDGGHPDEQVLLLSGVYNLGFVAVGATDEARRMLDWWRTRLLVDCFVDMAHGFFTDQRWIDFVPSLFEHHLVKDPTWNVAYWNLATRPLTRGSQGEILVSGRPRTFVHFSGYSPRTPHLLSKHQGPEPRLRLSEDPLLREMCDDYGSRLVAAGFLEAQASFRMPFAGPDGRPIDKITQQLIRAHFADLDRAARKGKPLERFDGLSVEEWLDTPVGDSPFPRLTRYLAAVYLSRPDLQHAFPLVLTGEMKGYFTWVRRHGMSELAIPEVRLKNGRRVAGEAQQSDVVSRPADRVKDTLATHGVEVAGYLTADLGLGESARQFVASLEHAGVAVSTTTYRRTKSRMAAPWTDRLPPAGFHYDISLSCVNADQMPVFRADTGAAYERGRYRIGLWFWELSDFPSVMHPALDLLDEVWVCSEFNRRSIAAHTDKPVTVMPHPAHAPRHSTASVPEVPSDGTFTFLFVFDYFSVFERKNPTAAIEAFTRAFPEPGEARLVIKSINGDADENNRECLRYLASGRPDIILIERYLAREELDSLMHGCDAYLSLHRSEGFGQTLAETMAIGKPVVATDYSGNLDFTRPDNSFLVPAELIPVAPGSGPYPTTAEWADPDLDAAATIMRQLHADPAPALERGQAAARTIAEEFSTEALARTVRARLEEIWATTARAPRSEPAAVDHVGTALERARRRLRLPRSAG